MINLAAIDLDALIPLIIGLFWVVAQIAGAAAKKKPRPSRPIDVKKTDSDPFAELMRRLGGIEEFKIPEPAKPTEPPKEYPWKPGEIEALPDMSVKMTAPPIPQSVMVPALNTGEIQDMDINPTMKSFKSAMPTMKLPAMKMRFQGSEKRGSGFPKVGKIINSSDRRTLRHAMLGHIILGKPKALGDGNTDSYC